MSRSARQWSDYRAHIKLLEGDLNECHKWYGLALIRLRFLLDHQPGSVTDAMVPTDGVYIRVDTRPNRVHIVVQDSGIYVESGFLDLLSSAECAEQTYLPAVLKYNTDVQNYVEATITPLQGKVKINKTNTNLIEYPFTGEALANNSESKAVGCTTKLPSVNPCGTEYTAGGYCDPAKIRMKKLAQATVPASMFSGKMRLWVQTLYGSTRDDYSVLTLNPDYKLYVGGLALSGFLAGNTSIYTTGDYRYYLITLSALSASVRALELNPLGNEIRQYLMDNPVMIDEKRRRLECYALAYAKISETATVTTISGVSVSGQSLADAGYAWAYDGSQGDVVTHEANESTRNYTARHYQVSITATENQAGGHDFVVNRSLVSSSEWWPIDGKINVIHPIYATANTTMLPPIGNIPWKHIKGDIPDGNAGVSSYSAKLWCFRDSDDVLQIADVNYSVSFYPGNINLSEPTPLEAGISYVMQHTRTAGSLGIYLGSFTARIGNMVSRSEKIELSNGYYYQLKEVVGDPVYYGFTFAGSNNNYFPYPGPSLASNAKAASGTPYSGQTLSDWMVANGYWITGTQSVIAGYIDRGDGVQTEIYYGADLYLQWYRFYVESASSADLNPSLFIEIPFGSFNSCFVGNYLYDKSSGISYESSDGLPITSQPWSPHHWEVITYYTNHLGARIKIGTVGHSQICTMMFYQPTSQVYESYSGSKNLKKQRVDYFDCNLYTSSLFNQSVTTTDQSQNWHFQGRVPDPLLGTIETSRVGFTGSKYSFSFGGVFIGDNEFPADSAVGWA